MVISVFGTERIKRLLKKELIYYIFPIFLIIILYVLFFPFDMTFIGEWHDIFANSMYYNLLYHNYFTTWNNLFIGGFPLIASPNSDKYYILSSPFYLIFQNLSVVNFIILFHLLIAYFAFFKLGTLLTKNYNALLIFSLLFSFSGVMLGRIYAGHHLLLYGLAWIPLLYYFFFKIVLFEESTVINAILLSIVSVFIYFSGNIYHFVLTYLLLLVFFLYYIIDQKVTKKVFYYLLLSIFLTTLLISIKSIPDIGISGSIFRNDIIDPLAGGGSLESDISSFILGTRIDTLWAQYESGVMIGIIPLLFVIIALIYGKREIIVPSFAAILLSIIWADGGKTIFSFIHLFPLVDNFRNPGRIFGALLPIILFLALYGTIILFEKIKKGGSFDITSEQRNRITIGVVLLLILKVIELLYQVDVGYMVIVTVLLLAGFVTILYFEKGSLRNILFYSVFALFVNLILIFTTYPIPGTDNLIKLVFITLLFTALFLYIQKEQKNTACSRYFCAILLAGIVVMMAGNLSSSYITIYNPELDKSPAQDIISEIKKIPTDNVQLWVYETGVPIRHMDFSYWDVVNAIHPMSVYSAYYLKTMPQITYTIGNVTYFSADFIVDTQYLENGNQNIPEASFKVHNISVYRPKNILPNVFLLRENVVSPLKIEKYSPDEVIVSGQFSEGDTVLLKGAYYTGWTANGIKSEPIGNMIGTKVSSKIDKITFKFDPLDYKIGALLSGFGAILLVVIIIKRDNIERFINKYHVQGTAMGSKKKKKKKQ